MYVARATRAEETPLRQPLALLPLSISTWQGRDSGRFPPNVERKLGADEYLNRHYVRSGGPGVSLYVGYYGSQREGETIHSPLNCLPAAGWEPVQFDRIDIPVSAAPGTIHVNRYVIEKGMERQVVLYWYQSHGRVVASEYWGRAFMVFDAMRLNRTDAAMIRVTSPVMTNESNESTAGQRTVEFVRDLFPLLSTHLPS
jgi:EpsI family protein